MKFSQCLHVFSIYTLLVVRFVDVVYCCLRLVEFQSHDIMSDAFWGGYSVSALIW
jgi:hypothetical protein